MSERRRWRPINYIMIHCITVRDYDSQKMSSGQGPCVDWYPVMKAIAQKRLPRPKPELTDVSTE